MLKNSSFSAVKVPISILAAELDNGTPPALLKQFEDALSKHKVRISKLQIICVLAA
jgi:dienelactone hydrolase